MTTKPNNTFFAQPKFLVGIRAMEHIPIELEGFNARRPLVISDMNHGKKYKKLFINSLAESNVIVGAFIDDALPYVNKAEIERIAGLFRWRGCDSVIAIGGGAVMNNAKALALAVANGDRFSPESFSNRPVPLVYIATSQIDGLEVTGNVDVDGKHFKSDFHFPNVVCIDNRMVALEKNKSNLIATAFLSLTHCIEGVASASGNPFADSAAFSAIRLICDNLYSVVKKRNDRKSLLGLINGIAIAGTVHHNTQVGIVGLSSQFLSRQTGVEAGFIAGFTLPVFIKYKLDNGIAVRDELLLALKGIDSYCAVSKGERLAEAQKTLADLTGLISTKIVFSNIQAHLLEKAAKYVETESNKSFSQNDCIRILNMAHESSKALLQ